MTASEAAQLILALTAELSATKRERDGYRLVARAGIHHAHDLRVELERLRDRYHRLLDERRQSRRAA